MAEPDANYQPDDVKSVFNPETGITSNYFGGDNRADGEWHGHIDLNEQGQEVYRRESGEKR